MTSFHWLLCPARCEGSERMNKEKGVREKNGGTREVSYIQTNISHNYNRMVQVWACVILCAFAVLSREIVVSNAW